MPCARTPHEPDPPAFPEWQHKLVLIRPWPKLGPKGRIKVTAGLHYLRGNALPYFSVTADIYRIGARDIEAGGQLVREVRTVFPELVPVQALHLSASDGVPLHALDNGWYHLTGYYGGLGLPYHAGNAKRQMWREDGTFDGFRVPTPEECLVTFAELVRLPLDSARGIADSILVRGDGDLKRMRSIFTTWVEMQRPRWKYEARQATELLDRLIVEGGMA